MFGTTGRCKGSNKVCEVEVLEYGRQNGLRRWLRFGLRAVVEEILEPQVNVDSATVVRQVAQPFQAVPIDRDSIYEWAAECSPFGVLLTRACVSYCRFLLHAL